MISARTDASEDDLTDFNRKAWADLCRVVAIFGVILIHACGANFYKYGAIPAFDWLSINFLDSLVRSSVPLFVLLSGALLLKQRDEPAKPLQVIERISKVAIPLLVWNIAYLVDPAKLPQPA